MKNYTKTNIERAWFSRLLRHPARKWRGSILITPEPTQGFIHKLCLYSACVYFIIIIIVYYARRQQNHKNKTHKITQLYIQIKTIKAPQKAQHQSTD